MTPFEDGATIVDVCELDFFAVVAKKYEVALLLW
jgi:hypothetical protein